jgi:hypothetical protein
LIGLAQLFLCAASVTEAQLKIAREFKSARLQAALLLALLSHYVLKNYLPLPVIKKTNKLVTIIVPEN